MRLVAPNRSNPFTNKLGFAASERINRWIESVTNHINSLLDEESRDIQFKDSAYTILSSDKGVKGDASGGSFIVILPDATKVVGIEFFVHKVDSSTNTITVDTLLTQTINGDSDLVIISEDDTATFLSDGFNYIVT